MNVLKQMANAQEWISRIVMTYIFYPWITGRTLFRILVVIAFIYNLANQLWVGVILALVAICGIAIQMENEHPSH